MDRSRIDDVLKDTGLKIIYPMKLINNLFQKMFLYNGSKIAFMVLSSGFDDLAGNHTYVFWETGLHDIANVIVLEGKPDPMIPIYLFFSLWGLQQILTCLISLIVLLKYQGLIP